MFRSEERREGKSVDLGCRRVIKKKIQRESAKWSGGDQHQREKMCGRAVRRGGGEIVEGGVHVENERVGGS